MKNKKPYFPFYSIFYLVFVFLLFLHVSVAAQNADPIEQPQGSREITNRVNIDPQNRLPQQNLRRVIPADMLELQMVTVPQLVGRNFSFVQITSILNRYGLRLGSAVPVANNDSVGIITDQFPAARQQVRPQTSVNITYGIVAQIVTPTQPQTVRVPDYVGLTLERALGRMPNDRLSPGNINEVNSDEPPGIVVNQFPTAGSVVDPGTQVILDVSTGEQEEVPVLVPRLVGLTLQQAAEVLRGAELFVGNINEQVSDEREGIIIEQFPRPETEVLRGSAVDIAYSVKAGEVLIPVPFVRQLFRDEAIRAIKESRLSYIIEPVNEPGQQNGTVVEQNPQPETLVPQGADVTIFVQDDSGIPPWIIWGGVVLLAGLAGGFIGRKIKPGKGKKAAGKKDVKLNLNPVVDIGEQTITSKENSLIGNELHLKFISDVGIQTLKTN